MKRGFAEAVLPAHEREAVSVVVRDVVRVWVIFAGPLVVFWALAVIAHKIGWLV